MSDNIDNKTSAHVDLNRSMSASNDTVNRMKWLTYMMFFIFAMTSDAVGVIIPHLVTEYGLTHTQASAFHYAPMIFIALSGLLLGHLADKLGRKVTICIGLLLFSLASFSFSLTNEFLVFVSLLSVVGVAIGMFKTGAIGLIGDISKDSEEHTETMNRVEGFFGIGAMVGPAIVSYLLIQGMSWKYLYVCAAVLCFMLCLVTYLTVFPKSSGAHDTAEVPARPSNSDNSEQNEIVEERINLKQTFAMMKDKYALGFSLAVALYVAVEVAIYVWMPSLFVDYDGNYIWMATYAITIFFALRAAGRFLGAWMLSFCSWEVVLLVATGLVAVCYLVAMVFGIHAAIWALPASGLFMSVIYPTLNSKGISCFPRSHHGAVAGVILFFTAAAAAIGPLVMGVISDSFGEIKYGFYLATGFSVLLFVFAAYNLISKPADAVLAKDFSADE